jgi:uridine phosphorylase
MPFPNFEGKHAHDPLFTAHDFLTYLRASNLLPDIDVPESAVLCYQPEAAHHLIGTRRPPDVRLFAPVHIITRGNGRSAVAGDFGIGAPVAALVMEHLIAWGVRRFFSIGFAGALQPEAAVGDIVVCSGAVRDEGVSHHYAPAERYARPSQGLSDALRAELTSRGLKHTTGETWTVDAPYRETVAEARHYQAEGVLSVEMEAAAVFTVARHHGVEAAAAFVISDSLAEEQCNPRFFDPGLQEALFRLADAAAACAAH